MSEKEKVEKKKEKKPDNQFHVDKLLRSNQKDYDQKYIEFIEYLNKDPFNNLNSVIDYMFSLYTKEEKNDKNRKKITTIFTNTKFISYITTLQNRSPEIFGILSKLDEKFDLQKYSELTLNMDTIFYGSIITDEENNINIKPPLNSKSIYKLIEIILENDKDLARKWILEVFSYDKTKLRNKKFEDIVNPDSEEFKKILINNSKANQIFYNIVFEKQPFQNLIELKNKLSVQENNSTREIAQLEESKKRLEYDVSSKQAEITSLKNDVAKKEQENEQLKREKNIALTECADWKSKFNMLQKRYDSNMSIAIKLQSDYEQLRNESAKKEHDDEDYINKIEDENEKLKKELETLKADFALKSHKLSAMAAENATSGSEARATTMKNLIQKISSPFYYLSMFCQEFNETQQLSEESAPFFIDTINQLESAFALMGAKKYGKLDEIVKFDSMLHEPQGGNLANGDFAKITEPGWKIEDEIFIKAKVEKSEEN